MKSAILTFVGAGKKSLTILLRYPTWIISFLIWPIIMPLVYILGAMAFSMGSPDALSHFESYAGTSDYVGFIAVGSLVWMLANNYLWNFGSVLRSEQLRGTLESNWITPSNKFVWLIGEGSSSLFIAFVTFIISIVEYSLILRVDFTSNIFEMVVCFLILLPGFYGFGLIVAGIVLIAKEAGAAIQILRGILTIFCAVSFPLAVIPSNLRIISDSIPITYGLQAVREVMLNGLSIFSDEFAHLAFMAVILGGAFLLVGRILFAYIQNQVQKNGSFDKF